MKPRGSLSNYFRKLETPRSEATADNYIEALKGFHQKTGKSLGMAKSMAARLSGQTLHRFATHIIKNDLLETGSLVAADKLGYFHVAPHILTDWVFKKANITPLRTAAKMFPKSAVMEFIRFVATNFNDLGTVLIEIRKQDGLSGYGMNADFDAWTPHRIRAFVHNVCEAVGELIPPEAKWLYIVVGLTPAIESYVKSDIELQDFLPIFRSLVGEEETNRRRAIDFIYKSCPFLASFVSEQLGFGARKFETEFVQACNLPINDKLHKLPHPGEVILDKRMVDNLARDVAKSRYFAMDFMEANCPDSANIRIGFVSICCRSKVFFAMPYLLPETRKGIAEVLKKATCPVIVYRWGKFKKEIKELYDWEPAEMYDVEKVAGEIGKKTSLDAMAEYVVGGNFCRRAANFGDAMVPSPMALKHRAIRVTLVYEFVVKAKKLREDASLLTRHEPARFRAAAGRMKHDRESVGTATKTQSTPESQRRGQKNQRGESSGSSNRVAEKRPRGRDDESKSRPTDRAADQRSDQSRSRNSDERHERAKEQSSRHRSQDCRNWR